MGASHCKSASCLVSCPCVFFRYRYVFNLSRDFTWTPHWGVMWIYGWELLAVYHHPDKSCGHKHCDIRDKFSICHVNFRKHMFKDYMNLWVEVPHSESPACHVWWSLVWCKWRYKVFNMSHDLTKPRDWGIK